MQHHRIGHDAAKPPVTFREMRTRLLHPVQPGRVLEGEVLPPESELMSRGRKLLDDIAKEIRAIGNIARR